MSSCHPHSVQEALEEPLERVDARVDAVLVQVLLQLGEELLEDAVVVRLETEQLREAGDEEAWKRLLALVRKHVVRNLIPSFTSNYVTNRLH